MLGRRQEINLQLTELVDSALIAFAVWFSHFVRTRILQPVFPDMEVIPPFADFFWVMAIMVPFTPIVLEARGFYNHILNKNPLRGIRQLVEAFAVISLFIGLCVVFFKWEVSSRSLVLMSFATSSVFLMLREGWQREQMRRLIASGAARERVLIVGVDEDVDRFLNSMSGEQRAEIEIMGRLDITRQPVSDLVTAMHGGAVSRVVFAAQHTHFARIEEAVQACEAEGVEAWIASDFFQTAIARPTFDVLGGKLMLVFHSTPQVSWALWFKDWLDRIGALVLLLISAPMWLVAILGIRLSSNGPVFFHQERAGRYGRPFRMWKFRTMHAGAEKQRAALESNNEMDGPVFKIKDDPRIFSFGAFLRRTSIDELPQLLNVLRGEMSLVGPRPLPVYEIDRIQKDAQRRRLSVKPGLTCLWQISGRNGISSFDDWVALDLKYIDNWSLWLDMQILARTIPAVLRGAGAS
jgi:exopolysaccharide biosynthesis polyprenyl glycosylphosphotransferase